MIFFASVPAGRLMRGENISAASYHIRFYDYELKRRLARVIPRSVLFASSRGEKRRGIPLNQRAIPCPALVLSFTSPVGRDRHGTSDGTRSMGLPPDRTVVRAGFPRNKCGVKMTPLILNS
ncbi:hypothetical protein A2Y83_01800 [Candidatus Falkowbacteria bacterium RBG_13_39_14]|uniref:Uncharacterized protein n=1 Tax=Candidatus Falkowbacteria bacterium RBG_13_39_14 TaxID=1797985 RepID=A0A1F5S2W1_9BACT|nr:MAG: hypothetical protein A2Y83_01800 [Candidatus Falkowbacteria bacterium RBG_13_39_14]